MKKEQLAILVIEKLKNEYPNTGCSLKYDAPWQLLIAVRLAAQCTDERVNQITPILFQKYPTIESIAKASYEDIADIVRPCGFVKSKAKDIIACMQLLNQRFNNTVPNTMEELLSLPGVGRKSANLILGDIFNKPAIVTDTHCIRLSNRIGLVENETNPEKVEKLLQKIIPPEEGNNLCHRFVDHGRLICTGRSTPHCKDCCLADICVYNICNNKSNH